MAPQSPTEYLQPDPHVGEAIESTNSVDKLHSSKSIYIRGELPNLQTKGVVKDARGIFNLLEFATEN